MDLKPHQIVRLLQEGRVDEVLQSEAIWLCTVCKMCSERCPNEVRIWESLAALRRMMAHADGGPGASERQFHASFLRSVRLRGRNSEIFSMGLYNLRRGKPFADMQLGLTMWRKGKLPLSLPRKVRDRAELSRLIRDAETAPKEQS
jgi:heterodisulfide reductase subunit C